MKNIYAIVLVAAVAIGYVGSRIWAQPDAQDPPPQTRIAFVNIITVFQKYEKAKSYKTEMENKLEPFKLEAKKLNDEAEQWRDWVKKNPNADDADRAKAERAVLVRKRRLEDINAEVSKIVGKQNEEHVVQLYKEVTQAVQRHAAANGFQAVLAYGDAATSDAELYGFANISRKVQGMEMGGGVSPMYIAPGLDISDAVLAALNRAFDAGAAKGIPVKE